MYWFTLCQLGVGFGLVSHARHLNRHFHHVIFSGLMCGRQTHMPPEPHTRIHEFVDKRVPQSPENSHSRSWFVHELFSSYLSSVLVHFLSAECRILGWAHMGEILTAIFIQYFVGSCMVDRPTYCQNLTLEFMDLPTNGNSNLKKIFILGAGFLTNSCPSIVLVHFVSAGRWFLGRVHMEEMLTAVAS